MSKRKVQEPTEASMSPEPAKDKKRKRSEEEIPEDEKLEIDVSAPEPPSKKAKRAEKKAAKSKKTSKAAQHGSDTPETKAERTIDATPATVPEQAKRSEYGIWIGNLLWTSTKDDLRTFFKDQGGIDGHDITRLHMPGPSDKNSKAHNKGFAYVDFSSQAVLETALGLSEKLMGGRKVLIKNAKSFEGRPEKAKAGAEGASSDVGAKGRVKEPTKRVFVGNLGFDVTKEDLEEHFGKAGGIEDIHMATFEDSGKCKGFAWIRFVEEEAAASAVRGYVYMKAESDDDDDDEDEYGQSDDDGEKGTKKRKHKARRHKTHINRLQGRDLRCEFAEDAQTRYKKRFGKGANAEPVQGGRDRRDPRNAPAFSQPPDDQADGGAADESLEGLAAQAAAAQDHKGPKPQRKGRDADERRKQRQQKHIDARTIAPGKALARTQRNTGAIVEGKGKKIAFD